MSYLTTCSRRFSCCSPRPLRAHCTLLQFKQSTTPRIALPSILPRRGLATSSLSNSQQAPRSTEPEDICIKLKPTIRENIYTIPNALTVSRIIACPILGYSIVQGDFILATSLLLYAGATDWIDGYVARRYNMKSVLGTILDPAADKALMTTLVITLAVKGLLPIPLAIIILGRDVMLSISAFYIRFKSLPQPRTFARYWDFGLPSAEVRPTNISKINTALQLTLMACTTASPLIPLDLALPLNISQWIVAGTTIWSGIGYLFSRDTVRYIVKRSSKNTN